MTKKTPRERSDIFYALYTEGDLTLQKIGDRYGITRERVRQLLTLHPKWSVTERHTSQRGVKTCQLVCKRCRKDFTIPLSLFRFKGRKYCSFKCFKKYATPEEARAAYNKRASAYYHRVLKKKPDWPQILRERNLRYAKARRAKK